MYCMAPQLSEKGGGYIEITHVDDSLIKQSRESEITIYMHDVNTEY